MKTLILLIALSLVTACGDDASDPKTTNNVNNVNNVNNSNNVNNVNNSNNINNLNNVSDMGNADAGEDMQADMSSTEDAGEDMASEEDMAPDMAMSFQWPATPADFVATANANTYLNTLEVPPLDSNDDPTCCKDFGARSANAGTDNALAALDALLAGVGVSLAGSLELAVQLGDLIVLLDHRELDSADDPDGFVLSWVNGRFTGGTTQADAAAGNGQFNVDADSFVNATGEPFVTFDPADMTNGMMSGGPTTGSIIFPLGTLLLSVSLQEAEIAGNATLSMDGVEYTQGTLSGYILVDDIMNALNEIAASPACSCLGLSDPLFTKNGNDWSGSCVSGASNLCSSADEETCAIIAGDSFGNGEICSTLPLILPGQADIDIDADNNYDALSLGLEWTGVNAEIIGLEN